MMKSYNIDHKKLSYYVPWILFLEPGIILNKNGSIQQTFKFYGNDLDSITDAELENINKRLNNVFKRMDGGWIFHIEARRLKSDFYKKGNFNALSGKIIDEERNTFFSKGNHFESYYYITFAKLIPKDINQKISGWFVEKAIEEKKSKLNEQIIIFKKELKITTDLLISIFLNVKALTNEETYTYLHSCISEKKHQKIVEPSIIRPIRNYLCDTPVLGGLKPKLGKKHIRTVAILDFPQFTNPGFFDLLNNLNFEYRWVTRFLTMSKSETLHALKQKYNKNFQNRISFLTRIISQFSQSNTDDHQINQEALERSEGIDDQINLVRGDVLSQGYFSCTLLVEDEDPTLADKKAERMSKVINNLGFITTIETISCLESFFGSIPGNINNNLRKIILNSITFSHLLPISSIWSGEKMNKHLNDIPLLFAETQGSTPFRLNLHVGDVGHTSIVGPTGSGKSVLLGLLASQFQKYKDAKIYFFDKDASSKILTYSMGGDFYDLGNSKKNIQFQPLANIDNPIELDWANGWLLDIFEQENIIITPQKKKKIYEALKLVAKDEKPYRTITFFASQLTDQDLQQAISPYTLAGSMGKYFDSNEENFEFSNWQVFEMGKIIKNKQVIIPLLNYLFHKIEENLDGSPTMIVLDECWMFFDNPVFSAKIREWLKVLRKKNASVVFATQELGDILNSPLFTTIIDACKTKIFLPNANAVEENYKEVYKKFGLNSREIQILANATGKKDYYVKSDLGSRRFELALGEKTLKLIASDSADQKKLAKKINDKSENADEFTIKWLNLTT